MLFSFCFLLNFIASDSYNQKTYTHYLLNYYLKHRKNKPSIYPSGFPHQGFPGFPFCLNCSTHQSTSFGKPCPLKAKLPNIYKNEDSKSSRILSSKCSLHHIQFTVSAKKSSHQVSGSCFLHNKDNKNISKIKKFQFVISNTTNSYLEYLLITACLMQTIFFSTIAGNLSWSGPYNKKLSCPAHFKEIRSILKYLIII